MAIPTLEHFLRKPFRYYLVLTLLALATPYAFAPYYYHFLMPFLFAGLIILTELRPNSRISTAYLVWFGGIHESILVDSHRITYCIGFTQYLRDSAYFFAACIFGVVSSHCVLVIRKASFATPIGIGCDVTVVVDDY